MVILAIDPGNTQSGWCIIDRETMKPQDFGKTDNNELLDSFERLIRVYQVDVVVIEMVACYGMPVGDVKCLILAFGLVDLQKNQSNYKRTFNT